HAAVREVRQVVDRGRPLGRVRALGPEGRPRRAEQARRAGPRAEDARRGDRRGREERAAVERLPAQPPRARPAGPGGLAVSGDWATREERAQGGNPHRSDSDSGPALAPRFDFGATLVAMPRRGPGPVTGPPGLRPQSDTRRPTNQTDWKLGMRTS